MSLKASNKVDTNRYEVEILINGEQFRAAIEQVYKRDRKKINVPGFRKGKAPLGIIEKYYGEGVFFEDALNLLYSDAIDDAAKEANLKIVNDEMKFDLVSISKQDGVDFKVTFTTYPEMEVGTYKGLKAEKLISEVTEQEVQEELNRMADRNSRMVEVKDRAAAKGDSVVIDFEGFTDGKAFEGGKGESYTLELGSGQFIPGFEDQIIGHNAEEEFEVNVTFPEEYGEKSLAGKPATFKVKLHEIKVKELPEQDDEFAKDVSEFDTLDALKEDLKKKALERKEKAANDDVENQLLDQLIEGLKGDIPEAMFKNREEQSLKDFEYRLQMQGMQLDMYLKYTGATVDDLKKEFRPQAERQVKVRLALEKIAELEKLTATEEDLNKEYETIAQSYGMKAEEVKKAVPAAELTEDIVVRKAIELVHDAAKLTDVKERTPKAEKAEAAAKKPAAKKAAATKTAAKKPAAKTAAKTAAKATTAKAAESKTAAKKPAAKKTTAAKKPAAKKPAAKKAADKAE